MNRIPCGTPIFMKLLHSKNARSLNKCLHQNIFTCNNKSPTNINRIFTLSNRNSLLFIGKTVNKIPFRTFISKKNNLKGSRSTLYYLTAIGILTVGFSYAAVPLYRIFCQAYSYGGAVQEGHDASKVEDMVRVKDRIIKIKFNADTAAAMQWNFRPQQYEIRVTPGETALAFYTAKNPTDKAVIGVSTYNVIPFEAGQYFNKIQCFCFEEQMLNPHEQVDMPVFFYIDPEFADDPKMEYCDTITLSYTFFEAKDGLNIPLPNFIKN